MQKTGDIVREPVRERLIWADIITCKADGDSLRVTGKVFYRNKADLMKAYESEEFSPHVAFANSSTDDGLLTFTEKWGPFITTVSEIEWPEKPPIPGTPQENKIPSEFRHASVLMKDLRREQRIFAALLRLTHATIREGEVQFQAYRQSGRSIPTKVTKGNKGLFSFGGEALPSVVESLQAIVDGTRSWIDQNQTIQSGSNRDCEGRTECKWNLVEQHDIENGLASVELLLSNLRNSQDEESRMKIERITIYPPVFVLRYIISKILNAFPMELKWFRRHPEERPSGNLQFGIRPVLMAMLRRDVLLKREVRLCVRPGCGRYFIATRIDKRCCDARCTERMKSRRQYLLRTKPRRQEEAKKKKP